MIHDASSKSAAVVKPASLSFIRFLEADLQTISDPNMRAALSTFNLAVSKATAIEFFTMQATLQTPPGELSSSQFCAGEYTLLVGDKEHVARLKENVNVASRLKLKSCPEVALEHGLEDESGSILVLKWPAPISNMVPVGEVDLYLRNYAQLKDDMQKLFDIGICNSYAVQGDAHHFVDSTGRYPFIVINDWNNFEEVADHNREFIGTLISKLETS